MSEELKPCPFCGSDEIEMVRFGTSRVSCIVECNNCGCRLESNENGYGDAWNTRCESGELPEWFVNKLNESIIDCGLLEAELKDDNDIEEAVRVSRRANTLRWVLSLRKPEGTE